MKLFGIGVFVLSVSQAMADRTRYRTKGNRASAYTVLSSSDCSSESISFWAYESSTVEVGSKASQRLVNIGYNDYDFCTGTATYGSIDISPGDYTWNGKGSATVAADIDLPATFCSTVNLTYYECVDGELPVSVQVEWVPTGRKSLGMYSSSGMSGTSMYHSRGWGVNYETTVSFGELTIDGKTFDPDSESVWGDTAKGSDGFFTIFKPF